MPNPTEIAGQYRALATILDARERRVGSRCGNRCSRLYPEIASLWQLSAKLRFAYRWEPPLSRVLLTLPFDAARCPDGLGSSASLRSGRIGEADPPHHRDRRRVAALPEVDPDEIARAEGRCNAESGRALAGELKLSGAGHPAAVRVPHGDGERQHEIVMPAAAGVEGQMAGRGELDPEILQLADQRLGLG